MRKLGSDRDRFKLYRSRIPIGKCGDWKVERFTVKNDVQLIRLSLVGRATPLGCYTRLCHKDKVVMSDTDAEIMDHLTLFNNARGRVLIHGLGLGVAVLGVLAKREVRSVDVVEIDADVIELVGKHIRDPRLTIHHADCFTKKWPAKKKWDCVWHDIWNCISSDNLSTMAKLREAFAERAKWQGFWAIEWIR